MSRQSVVNLHRKCEEVETIIPIGSTWRHYKGDVYEVIGLGINEATQEVEVQYRQAEVLQRHGEPEIRRIGDPDSRRYDLVFHRGVNKWFDVIGGILRYEQVYREEVWSDSYGR